MCVLLLFLFSAQAGTQAPGAVEELPAAIVLKPLFAQRVQILDVAVLDSRDLLVLDRAGVTRYEQEEEPSLGQAMPRWRRVESVSLPPRAWPRDLRGHLVSDKGYGVLLPGMNCTAQLNPLRMTCVEGRAPWPLLLPNSGLEPERNYFTTPEGMTFYGGSPIASDGEGFIVADRQGRLTQLDANRRPIADVGAGDDVVPLLSRCGARRQYLAASHGRDGDVLRALVVEGRRFVPATPDVPLPGSFTALSSVGDKTFVITRLSGADRYDAFEADISCGR